MSKAHALRALVQERLTAAAEEIFALFERTIAEYEEELRRSKQEERRKEELLQSVLSPRVLLLRAQHIPETSLNPGPENPETLQIKEEPQEPEEQRVKQEEEPLPVSEHVAVFVKTEESSLLHQTAPGEETREAEPHFHPDADNHLEWGPFSSCSEATGDKHHHEVWSRNEQTAAQNSHVSPKHQPMEITNNGEVSGTAGRADKIIRCCFCQKKCGNKTDLKVHLRVHTGERPFICSICMKTFTRTSHLAIHMRTHSGEKPYGCLICPKTFSDKSNLKKHIRVHTNERPFSCSACQKSFHFKHQRDRHASTHRRTFSSST
ncbi:oocyte zinc finger protein XlCOF8.4-like [Periophthalmus magnuspinnatus]|uniref:oocyte zinc finger protein XlCOF8.4-like n=1 Tax=Periophthalmus magnuspinnatus TaxID=409849 RepID=UPI00145A26D6|nr:oocyte zinc finger protein XlCOF8.4-like [Periophthalmus magnuspinnatus]